MSGDGTNAIQAQRRKVLKDLDSEFDVLVIGGGATGLGIALDAVTRGFRTALVEAGDFAQATSSRSTKLIHGGVRYLASGQMHLVYEALHERAVLKRNAPHLVEPLPLVLPSYSLMGIPWFGAGLLVYDLLSGSASMGRTRLLSKTGVVERIPGVATAGLRGGVQYYDAQFNDARLALTIARTAVDSGATVANHVRCRELLHANGRLAGARVEDTETGSVMDVRAGAIFNAAGIFVDQVSAMDDSARPPLLSLSRGTHIVVRRSVLGGEHAVMIPKTADGRVIFAIPWQGRVVVGTTDLPASATAMEPGFTEAEVEYLLAHINPYLTEPLHRADVLAVFSGLRPLVTGVGKTTSKLSREHHIDASASGLVTIAGGKWTTYRRMAEDAIGFAVKKGLLPERACITAATRLHGAPDVAPAVRNARAEYGTDRAALAQIEADRPSLGQPMDASLPYTLGMAVFAVRHEMARTLEDVLSRRTRALLLDVDATLRAAPTVAQLMASELGEDQAWIARELDTFTDLVRRNYELPKAG